MEVTLVEKKNVSKGDTVDSVDIALKDGESKNQNVIKEGKAEIRIPGMKNVFYNPVQEFNRDLR